MDDLSVSNSNLIDINKFLFSLFIVCIHTNILEHTSETINWYVTHLIFRMAVPFFFITTAYFFGKKFNRCTNKREQFNVVRQYIKKYMPLFIMWSTVGLIEDIFYYISRDVSYPIIRLIHTYLFYPKGAMWFVLACMVAVTLIYILWNKKILLIVCVIGYSFALLCNSYYFIVSDNIVFASIIDIYMKIFISARNGLFVGLPLFVLGIWYSKKDNFINKRTTKELIVIATFLFIILVTEVSLIRFRPILDDSSIFISMPFLAVILLEISTRLTVGITKETSIIFRRLSGYIYFLHRAIMSYLWRVVIIFIPIISDNKIIEYLFVILVCLIIWILTNTSNNKLIRKILP